MNHRALFGAAVGVAVILLAALVTLAIRDTIRQLFGAG